MFGPAASKIASAASEVSSSLPVQAGKTGFSETEVLKHVKALTQLGPPPVDSQADHLNPALQYVFKEFQNIKETADEEADVEVDLFPVKSGDSNLKSVVLRILPKNVPEVEENSILVSAHIDTVFSTEGAGDDSSNVAVMLELARGVSQNAQGLKNSVIFFLNTGEEEGLNGAHSFITQHPWSNTIRLAIDLESLPFAFTEEKKKKPSVFQELLPPGTIKFPADFQVYKEDPMQSATDFQIYKEVGGLSGLDFDFTDTGHVYHTKNDKFELLKPGSIQHLGENMLPFLLQATTTSTAP